MRNEMARRSLSRLERNWKSAFDEQVSLTGGIPLGDDANQSIRTRLALAARLFRQVYFSDVELRFGLSARTEHKQLAVLEQHPQTRRPWCEAMIPFVAGCDFRSSWHLLIESVWNRHAVSSTEEAPELLQWWEHIDAKESVVLALRPPLLEQDKTWPPNSSNDVAVRKGLDWESLQRMLQDGKYRDVTANELAKLALVRGIDTIDIYHPSRVRYLFFSSKLEKPVLIRESDLPGRHIAYIKRNRKTLD